MRNMYKDFRSEFPSAPLGDVYARSTYDKFGNSWIWRADRGMHMHIEPLIEARVNVEVHQKLRDRRLNSKKIN